MISLSLSRSRFANIWLGDLPSATYASDEILEYETDVHPSGDEMFRVAAVEMRQHRGGRMLYALLGGQFETDRTGKLRLNIHVNSRRESPFRTSLLLSDKSTQQTFVGLPSNFALAMGKAFERTPNINLENSGKFTINCAAYHSIESSEAFFVYVSNLLRRILNLETHALSEQVLTSLIESSNPP